MDLEVVYKAIGEFGHYQKYVVVLSSMTSFYAGLLFISSFFVLAVPNHRCAVPGLQNDTYAIQNTWHLAVINATIPRAPANVEGPYDQCNIITGVNITQTCTHWVYDTSIFQSTLAVKFNMVCGRTIMKSNAQMVFFGGLLAGSFFTGIASDKFGRKTTLCVSSMFYFVAALAIAWTPSYLVYVLLTFCVGFFAVGNFMPSFVLGMELVGPSKRRYAGMIGGYFWMGGNIALAGLGYLIRDWRTLQITCAAGGILFQLYWCIYPESPRWLYSRGRLDDAQAVLTKAAAVNKAELPEKFFHKVFADRPEIHQAQVWHLFTSRVLALRTSILFFNWFVVCLAYYGLALNSGDIGGDIFLNFFLQSLMDLPANVIVLVLLDRVGRKPLLVGSMLIGGVGCLATVFTIMYGGNYSQLLTTVLAMIGKVGASAAFSMVYVFTAELSPTVVRNAAMGSSSSAARVGGMIAPYIADLDRLVGGPFGKSLPQVVFGCLSIVAGILALYLPETLNRSLPETIAQGKQFGRRKSTGDKQGEVNTNFQWDICSTKL